MDGSQNIFALSTNQQINSENIEESASCNICGRTFPTNCGLLNHLNFWRRRNMTSNGNQRITRKNDDNSDNSSNSNNKNGNDIPDKFESQEKFWGTTKPIHPVAYDDMDKSVIMKAPTLTKSGSGPPGLDAASWRRILTSCAFGTATLDLRKIFAQLIKKLCVEELESPSSFESFVVCRLIPLDRQPGLRPIGVGEVLRRIPGKAVMMLL